MARSKKAQAAVEGALGLPVVEGQVGLGVDIVGVRDIEVRRTSKGRPYVVLIGRAREVAREQGVREIPLSLSFTHTEAVAFAMAITDEAVSAAKKRVDPMDELAAQFKEARALLDELPATHGAGENAAVGAKAAVGAAASSVAGDCAEDIRGAAVAPDGNAGAAADPAEETARHAQPATPTTA